MKIALPLIHKETRHNLLFHVLEKRPPKKKNRKEKKNTTTVQN